MEKKKKLARLKNKMNLVTLQKEELDSKNMDMLFGGEKHCGGCGSEIPGLPKVTAQTTIGVMEKYD